MKTDVNTIETYIALCSSTANVKKICFECRRCGIPETKAFRRYNLYLVTYNSCFHTVFEQAIEIIFTHLFLVSTAHGRCFIAVLCSTRITFQVYSISHKKQNTIERIPICVIIVKLETTIEVLRGKMFICRYRMRFFIFGV